MFFIISFEKNEKKFCELKFLNEKQSERILMILFCVNTSYFDLL